MNGSLLLVDSAFTTPIVSPFDNTKNYTGVVFDNTYNMTNNTGTISGQIQTPKNGTQIFNWWTDWFDITLRVIQVIFGLLFGNFAGQIFDIFGFPFYFKATIWTIYGLLLSITAIYYLTGKGL